ncbi:MAG: membrane dipeptidase [Candidatus Gerdarchaeota archaeon]|nr:MAG: membrane dipeptidase [Candidatus Gerdarchaeota archaeon]
MKIEKQLVAPGIKLKDKMIIDGHTDVLFALTQQRRVFYERSEKGHVDLPRAKEGNVLAMFFAIWPGINQYYILKGTRQLLELVENKKNNLVLVKNVDDLEKIATSGKLGAIFHIEGIGGFDSEFHLLHVLYRLGLRSFGITWSDENLFGTGSSFDPNTPEDTRGLTAEGKELIHEANKLGVIVDVSHLSDKSFWDAIDVTNKPLIASHSSCRVLSPHVRNLTDDMIKAIADINGMVGINFGNMFLREDCSRDAKTPFTKIIDHIDHVVNLVGPDYVGFGSDFDGTLVPDSVKDVTGFNLLVKELEKRDYSLEDINKICHGNFMRIFKEVWK